MRLERDSSQLLIVDMQEQALDRLHKPKRIVGKCARLVRAAHRLDVPVTFSAQTPEALGRVSKDLTEDGDHAATILSKLHFSCMRDETLGPYLKAQRRFGCGQLVIAGIETHVAVAQTVLDLQQRGFATFVVADACASRDEDSHDFALDRMMQVGAQIVDFETVLFEWLDRSGTPAFKDLQELID